VIRRVSNSIAVEGAFCPASLPHPKQIARGAVGAAEAGVPAVHNILMIPDRPKCGWARLRFSVAVNKVWVLWPDLDRGIRPRLNLHLPPRLRLAAIKDVADHFGAE